MYRRGACGLGALSIIGGNDRNESDTAPPFTKLDRRCKRQSSVGMLVLLFVLDPCSNGTCCFCVFVSIFDICYICCLLHPEACSNVCTVLQASQKIPQVGGSCCRTTIHCLQESLQSLTSGSLCAHSSSVWQRLAEVLIVGRDIATSNAIGII